MYAVTFIYTVKFVHWKKTEDGNYEIHDTHLLDHKGNEGALEKCSRKEISTI
jgi:hypothetical protein